MPDFDQQDRSYQPSAKAYTFSTNPSASANSKSPQKPSFLKLIFYLFGLIACLILFFLLFLVVFNYFRRASLLDIPPDFKNIVFQQELKSNNILGTDQYEIEGTLYDYNKYLVKVKFYNQTITLKFNPAESRYFTQIDSKKELFGSESADMIQIPGFFSDLEQEKNIGKKINVVYKKDSKGNKIINTITLENN